MKRAIEILELTGAIVLSALMAGTFVAGGIKIAYGVGELLWPVEGGSGVGNLLRGIEYLFMAPLILISYVSMLLFSRGFFDALNRSAEHHDRHAGENGRPFEARHAQVVHGVKESLAALMIAILLTDLVDKALTNTMPSWLALTTESVGVVLSGCYLLLLRREQHLRSAGHP